jgi:deoxycytidylate deaminase
MEKWYSNIPKVDNESYKDLLRTTYNYSWEHSDDNVTKTGAIIVSPDLKEILAYGTNHFSKGIIMPEDKKEDRDWRMKHIIHSEPAAVHYAARKGHKTEGTTMVMDWVPCTECAKVIVDSSISNVIGHEEKIIKTPEHWDESCSHALNILKIGRVDFKMYSGKIGGCKNLMRNHVWEP